MRKQFDSEATATLKWHIWKDQRRITKAISTIIVILSIQYIKLILPKTAKMRKYYD